MANDSWFEFNGQELINVARTTRLARAIGLDTVRIREELAATLEDRLLGLGFGLGGFGLGGFGGPEAGYYANITHAPWYDAGVPASEEFAGIVPLSFRGLDDSTLESSPVEYITDGGHSGKSRNATLTIVASVGLVATTERGAEYGKRWMDRVLKSSGANATCSGGELTYLRYMADDAPVVHRRDVRLTRGSSITRKKLSACSATWLATFTLTAADPYEYGVPMNQFEGLGGEAVTGLGLDTDGSVVLTEIECPTYDYTPIYDPLYPALIPSPSAPDFLPDGWDITAGMTFERFWATLDPVEPSDFLLVPSLILSTTIEARMVRVAIWPSDADPSDQCAPLWSIVVSYLPAGVDFYVDGEQKSSYAWDGSSTFVRRTDSLVYSADAGPVQWASFNDPDGLLVTLDLFTDSDSIEGGGNVRLDLSLIPKSD